jgi:hypothetical protein
VPSLWRAELVPCVLVLRASQVPPDLSKEVLSTSMLCTWFHVHVNQSVVARTSERNLFLCPSLS